jgi:hypothetical protein
MFQFLEQVKHFSLLQSPVPTAHPGPYSVSTEELAQNLHLLPKLKMSEAKIPLMRKH